MPITFEVRIIINQIPYETFDKINFFQKKHKWVPFWSIFRNTKTVIKLPNYRYQTSDTPF